MVRLEIVQCTHKCIFCEVLNISDFKLPLKYFGIGVEANTVGPYTSEL